MIVTVARWTLLALICNGFVLGCNQDYSDFCDHENEDKSDPKDRVKRAFQPFRSERELSKQISTILDELLVESGYDRQIRPQISGPPLEVEVNVAIRSMGPVDETSQTFTMDCYFRQYWTDFRLKYNNTRLRELPMNWQFLTKIWRPDTVIINGKDSYLHKMTVYIPKFLFQMRFDHLFFSRYLTVSYGYLQTEESLIPRG